ncbi:MAG: class I SAM-dependent methyltransferase [Anaerolineales bacterium]|nr:class I SAM-dependent methyltransferase [Anaerolineales bacterium]
MFHAADELQYNDSRLAELYDTLNEWGEDNAFYMQTAGTTPVRILDAGCGTGLLAVALARAGHTVVGVDPAGAMLRVAQNRPDSHLVQWRQSTLQAFHSETPFDLIIMAGNAFQVFLTDEAMAAAFAAAARLLGPAGRFVFESRNPAARAWERWTQARTTETAVSPAGQPFTMYHQFLDVAGEIVRFASVFQLPTEPEPIYTETRIRFAPLATIKRLAAGAGLVLQDGYGDWDRSPLTADSRKMILMFVPVEEGRVATD